MVTIREISYDIADIIATHHLLHYVKNGETQAVRFVTGATAAGLGFAFGPRIQELLKGIPSRDLPELMTKDVLQTLAYAAAGGAAGYFIGQRFSPDAIPKLDGKLLALLDKTAEEEQRPRNELLELGLTAGSIGWLGYSVMHRKEPVDKTRQWWGLGGAAIGYLFGPELLRKARDITIPDDKGAEIKGMYAKGGAIAGMLAGAGFSMYARREVRHGGALPDATVTHR